MPNTALAIFIASGSFLFVLRKVESLIAKTTDSAPTTTTAAASAIPGRGTNLARRTVPLLILRAVMLLSLLTSVFPSESGLSIGAVDGGGTAAATTPPHSMATGEECSSRGASHPKSPHGPDDDGTSSSSVLPAATAAAAASAALDIQRGGGIGVPSAPSITERGVELPGVRTLEGIPLYRNGHGVRSVPFFGMNVQVYVAGFYSASPLRTGEEVMEVHERNAAAAAATEAAAPGGVHEGHPERSDRHLHHQQQQQRPNHPPHGHPHPHHPMQLDFTFLRDVGRSRVESAWTTQLDHSVSYRYDGYDADREAFLRLCSVGPIKTGGTQTVQLVRDGTKVVDQGVHTGTVPGPAFQRAFLSMWFGDRAVADDLKAGLLRGDAHPHPPHSHPPHNAAMAMAMPSEHPPLPVPVVAVQA